MVRSRSLIHLVPVALLLLGWPLAARAPVAAAAPLAARAPLAAAAPRQPVLAVPRALLHRAAVHVIVEMTGASPTAALRPRSSQLQSLLAGVRAHLLAVLGAEHARDVYAFHLVPQIAATVPGADLPGLLAQPGVRAIVLDQWHRLAPTSGVASVARAVAAAGTGPTGVRRVVDAAQTVEPESFDLTGAHMAQAHGYDGAGVRVAIIDSGLDVTQPDLAGLLATDAQGTPLRVDFTGTDLQDTVGHGTACAGLIAAQGRGLYTADTLF
ncbi:MAG TPA: S8 family serine peptidase, partial [Chloroflexota bacterium]|nr:S8 family serine peptidase [Chloroflexota bacterium]